jgi:hypothetical protein
MYASSGSKGNWGSTEIEAESDSLEVVDICPGQDCMLNDATVAYAEIVTFAGAIGKVELNYCGRDLNKVAHSLAKEIFLFQMFHVIWSMNPLIFSYNLF